MREMPLRSIPSAVAVIDPRQATRGRSRRFALRPQRIAAKSQCAASCPLPDRPGDERQPAVRVHASGLQQKQARGGPLRSPAMFGMRRMPVTRGGLGQKKARQRLPIDRSGFPQLRKRRACRARLPIAKHTLSNANPSRGLIRREKHRFARPCQDSWLYWWPEGRHDILATMGKAMQVNGSGDRPDRPAFETRPSRAYRQLPTGRPSSSQPAHRVVGGDLAVQPVRGDGRFLPVRLQQAGREGIEGAVQPWARLKRFFGLDDAGGGGEGHRRWWAGR